MDRCLEVRLVDVMLAVQKSKSERQGFAEQHEVSRIERAT